MRGAYTFPCTPNFRRKRDLSTNRLATVMPFAGVSLLIHSRVRSFICSMAHKHTRTFPHWLARSLAHPYHLKWDAHNPIRLGLIKIHQNGIYLCACAFFCLCSMYLDAAYAFLSTAQSHSRIYVSLWTIKWFISIAIEIKIQIPIRTPSTHKHTHAHAHTIRFPWKVAAI